MKGTALKFLSALLLCSAWASPALAADSGTKGQQIYDTLLITLTTFSVVFVVFFLLYLVMLAMSLVSRFDKTVEKPVAAAPAAVAPVAPASAAALPGQVTPQIVAAITAALVAELGDDNFTITSITPVARVGGGNNANSAWAQAGRGKQMQGPQAR